MGKCWSRNRIRPNKDICLLMVGLDNAGKTSIANWLMKDSVPTAPTVGCSIIKPRFQRQQLTIYDLGGGPRIRDIWKNYYAESHGIIFVVDSTAKERLDEAGQIFYQVLQNPMNSGKPILLLANKQDTPTALDLGTISDQMNLADTVNTFKSLTKVEGCAASVSPKKRATGICAGLAWLLAVINMDLENLTLRVEKETLRQREEQQKELQERIERVRKIREEREKAEGSAPVEEPGNDGEENPFRPIEEIRAALNSPPTADVISAEDAPPDDSVLPPAQPSETSSCDVADLVPDSSKSTPKKKKKRKKWKANKTAPAEAPVQPSSWSRGDNEAVNELATVHTDAPITPRSRIKLGWGLTEDLQLVTPKTNACQGSK